MSLPLYSHSSAPNSLFGEGSPYKTAHAGLWWDKFFNQYDANWTVGDHGKSDWIATVVGKRGPSGKDSHLTRFVSRQFELGTRLGAAQRVFKTDWHFATGLGLSHPVENGFTWHPTLGVPYLPASSIKGMLRAWAQEWQDFGDGDNAEADKQATIRRWFGCDDKDEEKAGDLIFFDAIPTGQVEIVADVMTPHMGKWYEQGNEMDGTTDDAKRVPADWHSPIPIVFLVVKEASFLFQIAPRGNVAPEEAASAMQQLPSVLEWLGAGAKTAVGYGRMSVNDKELDRLKNEQVKRDGKRRAPEPVVETIEEAIAAMIEAPASVPFQIDLGEGEIVPCVGVSLDEAKSKWSAGIKELLVIVSLRNGVAVSATWQGW